MSTRHVSAPAQCRFDRGRQTYQEIVHWLQTETDRGPQQEEVPPDVRIDREASSREGVVPRTAASDALDQPARSPLHRREPDRPRHRADKDRPMTNPVMSWLIERRQETIDRKHPEVRAA